MALAQERAERERLRGRPVDAFAGLDRLGAGGEEALDGAVDVEILRHRRDLAADLLQLLDSEAGIAAARVVGHFRDLEAGPAAVEPIRLVRLVALARLLLGVEPRTPVGLHLLDLAVGDDVLADELLRVDLERGRM